MPTQILSMDLTGSIFGHSVAIVLDPTRATTGSTTIAHIGGGLFHITSFFDVFTEISLDGGNTFIPQTGGPAHVVLQTAVPEPSALVMGAIAATVGLAYAGWRRRRAT